VVALAPWLPDGPEPEPVKQLIGRRVLIVHGTDDGATDPELSYRLAERAKKVNREVCRFEVHSDGHGLNQHRNEVFALTADFVLGSLVDRPYARPVTDALAAPPPLGLRMPLASGFGRSLGSPRS
jgi:pimeloyl-ACP methyl ester carboxylesterase